MSLNGKYLVTCTIHQEWANLEQAVLLSGNHLAKTQLCV